MLKIAFAAATLVAAGYAGAHLARGVATESPGPSSAGPRETRVATAQTQVASSGIVVSLAHDNRGHFTAEPQINGVRLQMLVDTGASVIALSAEDASRAGIFPNANDFRIPVNTANGTIKAASVRLREVQLGRIVVRDVEAVVMPQGRLGGSLLGMSFLRRLSSFNVSGGTLVLRQ
ncbi:MAG: retropepsin-like aspartic protease family protein [Alsobacter sp.]